MTPTTHAATARPTAASYLRGCLVRMTPRERCSTGLDNAVRYGMLSVARCDGCEERRTLSEERRAKSEEQTTQREVL